MGKDLNGKELGKGIVQRKNGLYQARVFSPGNSNGVCFYSRDLKEVKEKKEEFDRLQKEKVKINKMKLTFGKWFDQWMSIYKVGHIKETTVRNYWSAYNRCRRFLENKKLGELDLDHFQKMVNTLYKEGYNITTIKPTISVIEQCLDRAVYNRFIPYNPCVGIIMDEKKDFTPVKEQTEDNKCLTNEELIKFFTAANGTRYMELFFILLHTGMRSGELCALEWDDIDFENGFIHVYKTINRVTRYYDEDGNKLDKPIQVIRITSPKREASNRYIPMYPQAANAFLSWKKKQDADKRNNKAWGKDNFLLNNYPNLVFTTTPGNPLTPTALYVECKRITEFADAHSLEDSKKNDTSYTKLNVHPHLFRHTFTTRCYEAGIDPLTLSMIVGHSKQKMTKHYTHPGTQFINSEFNKYTNLSINMQFDSNITL